MPSGRQHYYPDHRGGCCWCPADALKGHVLCARHVQQDRDRKRKLYRKRTGRSWRPGGRGQPPAPRVA